MKRHLFYVLASLLIGCRSPHGAGLKSDGAELAPSDAFSAMRREIDLDQWSDSYLREYPLSCWITRAASVRARLPAADPATSLADEEIISLINYFDDAYVEMNRALRGLDPEGLERWHYRIAAAVSGLKKLPVYQGVVRRGATLKAQHIDRYRSAMSHAELLTEPAFTSTSIGPGYQGNVKFVITSRTGRVAGSLAPFPEEHEVLLLPGSRFEITSIELKDASTETIASNSQSAASKKEFALMSDCSMSLLKSCRTNKPAEVCLENCIKKLGDKSLCIHPPSLNLTDTPRLVHLQRMTGPIGIGEGAIGLDLADSPEGEPVPKGKQLVIEMSEVE